MIQLFQILMPHYELNLKECEKFIQTVIDSLDKSWLAKQLSEIKITEGLDPI